MKTSEKHIKEELVDISHDLTAVLAAAQTIPGFGDSDIDEWSRICQEVEAGVADAAIRAAVAGAIKSGKSTFVNALFGGDYLKRGAGVMTAMITRIRPGDRLRATLSFKTWQEINQDMNAALSLFPGDIWQSPEQGFDLRDKNQRQALAAAVEGLAPDQQVAEDARNPQIALLTSYLKGYDAVCDSTFAAIAPDEPEIREFEAKEFADYRPFAVNDHLAVFLKNIRLTIDGGKTPENTEIADCQGSDSPNPLHLAMIEDYLQTAHLIVYVISSRTGVRRADIKFLNIIRKMGMLDQTMFVVNVDLSEHETAQDLTALLEKVREDLSLIVPAPEVHSFSALLELFRSPAFNPTKKDQARQAAWEAEDALRDLSDQGAVRFMEVFSGKLTHERDSLLFKSHLERLGMMAAGISHRMNVRQELISRDAEGADEMISRIKVHQEKMAGIQAMVRSTLEGTARKLKDRLKSEVDRFFDAKYAETIGGLLRFIGNYSLPVLPPGKSNGEKFRFHKDMHYVYSDFKQSVDRYMAETVNPEIIRFVRDAEGQIKKGFESVTGPYDVMLSEVLTEYNRTLEKFSVPPVANRRDPIATPDVDAIRESAGVALPAAETSMRHSARVKSDAILKLSVFSLFRLFKKLIKKSYDAEAAENRQKALKTGLSRLKAETRESVIIHFKDYRENLKYQYFFKIVDAGTRRLNEELINRFRAYSGDLSEIVQLMGKGKGNSTKLSAQVKDVNKNLKNIQNRIDQLRERMAFKPFNFNNSSSRP